MRKSGPLPEVSLRNAIEVQTLVVDCRKHKGWQPLPRDMRFNVSSLSKRARAGRLFCGTDGTGEQQANATVIAASAV